MRLEILALLFFGGAVTFVAAPDKIPLTLERVDSPGGCGCYLGINVGEDVFSQCVADDDAAHVRVNGEDRLVPRVSGKPRGHEVFRDRDWTIDVRFHDVVNHCPEPSDCEGDEVLATIHVVTSTGEALVETAGGCGC